MSHDHSLVLNTGAKMPVIGLGTWKSPPGKVWAAVEYAVVDCGYQHIDCAAIYCNQEEIGQAFGRLFSGGKAKRDEVFVTSKLWNDAHATADVGTACRQSLHDLQLDYLDLYLMHWGVASVPHRGDDPVDEHGVLLSTPVPIQETWRAMEDLVETGLVRSIGVANFTGAMLLDLLSYARIPPAVNQIELHPYLQQSRLVEFCQYKNISVTAYSPLGSPGNMPEKLRLLDDRVVVEIARRQVKTPAQILIRWAIERGTIVIPKSVTPERIRENIDVFDFALAEEDAAALQTLERRYRYVDPWEWWKVPYFD